jgi:hypothetical protein
MRLAPRPDGATENGAEEGARLGDDPVARARQRTALETAGNTLAARVCVRERFALTTKTTETAKALSAR